MPLKWKKILTRALLIFSIIFCGIVLSVPFFESSGYRGSTSFAIFANNETSAQHLGIITENVEIFLEDPSFKDRVSGIFYEETGEWKRFSLTVENPAGSVVTIHYEDQSIDPYAVREAIQSIRIEAVKTISKNYDLSRDISVRFLDGGIVFESQSRVRSLGNIALFSGIITLFIEGILYWRFLRQSEDAFRSAIKEKMTRVNSRSEWWRSFQPKKGSPEIPEEETKKNQEEIKKESVPEKKAPDVKEGQVRATSATVPLNLPIAVGVPEILKPYLQEREILEKVGTEAQNGDNKIYLEEETIPSEEPISTNDESTPLSVLDQSEPSQEELKERLNKLLRGEL